MGFNINTPVAPAAENAREARSPAAAGGHFIILKS